MGKGGEDLCRECRRQKKKIGTKIRGEERIVGKGEEEWEHFTCIRGGQGETPRLTLGTQGG